jgi:hypothetical protein
MKTATTNKMDMAALAQRVALALSAETGASWKSDPVYKDDDGDRAAHQYLMRDDGLRLWVSGPDWSGKDRLNVSHSATEELRGIHAVYDGNERVHAPADISVSALKDPAQIARDIARRLVPSASVYFAKLKAQHAKNCAYENAKLAFFEELGKASGGKLGYEWGGSAPDLTRPRFTVALGGKSEKWNRHGYGEITVPSGEYCKITLESVPRDVALKICEFLRDSVYAETPGSNSLP